MVGSFTEASLDLSSGVCITNIEMQAQAVVTGLMSTPSIFKINQKKIGHSFDGTVQNSEQL